MKRANVYRMYKGYRICSSFFDEELKNLYEESSFLKEYFLALQERYYSLKEKQLTETALDQEAVVVGVPVQNKPNVELLLTLKFDFINLVKKGE